MKKSARKIQLHRETLAKLDTNIATVANVAGGATRLRTECGSCPASACHPTLCLPCQPTYDC
jgi:hypothetical protein